MSPILSPAQRCIRSGANGSFANIFVYAVSMSVCTRILNTVKKTCCNQVHTFRPQYKQMVIINFKCTAYSDNDIVHEKNKAVGRRKNTENNPSNPVC